MYADADVGIVMLRDREIFREALPTKLLEILCAGRPAVVAARGNPARLVEAAGAGVAVAPEDPAALADALLAWPATPRPASAWAPPAAGSSRSASRAPGRWTGGWRWSRPPPTPGSADTGATPLGEHFLAPDSGLVLGERPSARAALPGAAPNPRAALRREDHGSTVLVRVAVAS